MPRKNVTDIAAKTPTPSEIVHCHEYDQFAQWMALPKRLREPETHSGCAEKYTVSPDTLADRKKRDAFWLLVKDYRSAFLKETIPDILDDAIRAAKGDSYNDRELL